MILESDFVRSTRIRPSITSLNAGSKLKLIYQNCVIFNDGAFDDVADKAVQIGRAHV